MESWFLHGGLMNERSFVMMCLLACAASMACGRTQLGRACPECNQGGRDALNPGAGVDDGSAPDRAAEAAREASGPDEPAANCGYVTMSTSRVPVDILIVLDRSASMELSSTEDVACVAGSACSSRWQVMSEALKMALAVPEYVRWGLKLYPSPGAGICGVADGVEVALALDSAAAIADAIDNAVPSGSAPVGDAIRKAGKYLQGVTDDSQKVILLATSGAAACVLSEAGLDAGPPEWSASQLDAVQAILEVHSSGIPVYVLSFDSPANAGAHAYLDALANAGSTTAFYLANDPKVILNDLFPPQELGASCMMSLPQAPPDPENVTVTINGQLVPRDPTQLQGWDYARPDLIVFFGSSCDQLIQLNSVTVESYNVTVEIVFGCP